MPPVTPTDNPAQHRHRALLDLLDLQRPLDTIVADLRAYPDPCPPDLQPELTRAQAIARLDGFIDEDLPLTDLAYWGQLVLGADDIRIQNESETLKQILFVLAYPGVNTAPDQDRAQEWIAALEAEERETGG